MGDDIAGSGGVDWLHASRSPAAPRIPLVKAAKWFGPRDVRIVEVEPRSPGPDEVALDVAYCGLCGSDLHEYADGPHAIPVDEPHPASGRTAPLVLGHEFCGTVTAVGHRVGALRPGDRVAVEPSYRCGQCPRCRAGEYNLCRWFGFAGLMGDGGLAASATVPAYMAHPLPTEVSLEQAALFEPASVALHGLRRGALVAHEELVVVGLGPIGQFAVQLAAARGVERIIGVDPLPGRRALARELGAGEVRAPDDPLDVGADVAVEAVGAQSALDSCLAATRRGGRVVLLGLGGQLRFDGFALVNHEQSILASASYRNAHEELTALVRHGLDLTRVVTATIGLDEVVERGFERLTGATDEIKVLVDPRT